ncbi:hypothetical protein EZV62_021423 [Acer yangbiense]|uniref:Uncharacterized protein n=1 Tax=Acer yangbiense TaxID=1000413 RepID=A0A5C7H5I6_9ROSI|nr:hypothetical protein EZV62_021423 [Acer yangbiense]
MELRSYNHLHFVQAIKGGSVIKLLNVACGRPVLTFKKIEEIYKAGGAKHDDSVPTPWSKEGSLFDPNRVKLENPLLPGAERSTIIRDFDTSVYNCSTSDEERNSDLDDASFGNTTLKQIKESCKARKRKLAKYVNSSKESFENCFPLKQVYIKLEPEEDEIDLEQPLSIWKLKISMIKKRKRKCIRTDMSTSSQSAINDQNISQPIGNLPTPIDTTAEVNEPNYFDFQTMTRVAADSSFDYNEPVDSCGEVINKAHVTAGECDLETDVSMSSTEEQYCVVNEASYEPNYFDFQTMTPVAADSSVDYNEPVDSCGVGINKVHVTAGECDLETDVPMSSTKEQCCVVNEASYECLECADPESVHDLEVSGWELVNVECQEIINYNFLDSQITEFENERYIIHPPLDIIPPQPISVIKDYDSYMSGISHSYPSIYQISWPSSSDNQVQGIHMDIDNRLQCTEIIDVDGDCLLENCTTDDLPSYQEGSTSSPAIGCIIGNRLQCMEIIDVDGECRLENCTADDLPSYQEAGTISPFSNGGFSQSSNPCPSPDKPSVSVAEDSPLAEDKQLPLSACAHAVRNCSTAIHPVDVTEELTPSDYEDHQQSKLVCRPERLLSTRKVISPTSRERLRKAMQASELHDDKHTECRGKLWFGKQTENTVVKAEGCYKIRRAGVTINMKQVPCKPKYDKKGSHSKGILKGSHLSSAVPSLSTRCTSSGSLSQSAIAFSQRQMQDIESLATKLTGELSSMKDIVNELLHSQAFPATAPNHDMDKVTMAIQNATKAEETTKRWLSIMARDCNRFCKIMNLSETHSIASGNVVHKDKKKITFADEAGGKLCHVKVFKDDTDSEPESSEIEK